MIPRTAPVKPNRFDDDHPAINSIMVKRVLKKPIINRSPSKYMRPVTVKKDVWEIAMGTNIKTEMGIASARMGVNANPILSAAAGVTSSFAISFTKSAKG
jgi:putative aminopeptidase FrvX